jgi:hypothetical protein
VRLATTFTFTRNVRFRISGMTLESSNFLPGRGNVSITGKINLT